MPKDEMPLRKTRTLCPDYIEAANTGAAKLGSKHNACLPDDQFKGDPPPNVKPT